MPPLPRRFARYEIVDEIARGAHGVVYRARDLELGRTVALKLLREEEATPEGIERFRREARVAARLRHPGIMDVFDAGEEDGRPYFTMPLIDGPSLAWLIHSGELDARAIARVLAQVARAVHFAHERGVVHRDLKPTNVLMRSDGTPVVTDFGIAREGSSWATLTKAGELLGTPMYMAPEQIAGRVRDVDSRTDVYALGVVLYEMLVRRPPFDAISFADLSSKILNDPPTPPSRVSPLVDRDLELICLRCLRKEPGERYATAGELADDLERVVRGARVAVPREATRSRRLAPRHKLAGMAAGIALLGAGVALTAGAFSRAEPGPGASAVAEIETEPAGASIYVDDRFLGTTPRTIGPCGEIELRLAGFVEAVVPGRAGRRRFRLVRAGEIPEGMAYGADAELFVDRTEVTGAEYTRFIAATGHRAPPSWRRGGVPRGEEPLPVTGVSCEDAQAYAAWAGKRLPTAQEWAAVGRGAQAPMVCAPADGAQEVAMRRADRGQAGCFDMLGNVEEWTATVGTAGPQYRVVCGGSWERAARECTLERAVERRIDYRARDLGFRCVMDPPWRTKK